jgi:hypothetical protein
MTTTADHQNPLISCQCGTITLRAPRPRPSAVYICHCLECRKQSASAFGVTAIFPAEPPLWPLAAPDQDPDPDPDLDLQQPHDVVGLWTRPTDSGNTLECYFCKRCGVRFMHRAVRPDGSAPAKPTVSVKGGCLEGVSLEGARHIWVRSALVPVPEGSDEAEPQEKPGTVAD